MIGDKSVKPWFAGFGELIGLSIGLAAIAWVLDSILDSVIFHDGTVLGQILFPTVNEIVVRVLFGFVIIVFGTYTQLNMSRRRRVEKTLLQSEEKYRMLVENIQEGVFIIQDAKFQFVNEAFARTAGYEVGELIGRDFKDLVAPEDLEMVADRYSRRQAGENIPDEYEFHVLCKDGTRIVVNMNVGLVTYRNKVASMGILKDITEQKRAEKALEEAVVKAVEEKNKSNAIIAALGDGIIIQDTDYKIVYQNQVQNDLFGNRVGEYCYKAYEGRDTICEWCPVEITFRDGKIHRTDREVNTENGTLYYELTSSPLRDSTGKIIAGIKVVRNITERKRAEEKLREGEQFLASIFESIQDGIGIIDKDMNVLRVNKTTERWYPHTSQFIGRKCYEVYHGRKERCEACPAWRTLKTGKSAHDVVPKHGPGGKEVGWAEIYSFPFFDTTTGQMKGAIEYVRDITERRRVEEELRQSEEKYRLLVENIQEGVFIIQDFRLQYGNKTLAGLIGYTLEEVIGRDFREFIAPEDLGLVIDHYRRRLAGENVSHEYEFNVLCKDGTKIIVNMNVGLVTYHGRVASMGILKDVTERKKIEKEKDKLLKAIENSTDGITIADEKDRYIYVNAAYAKTFGYAREELVGKTWRKITPPLLIAPTEKGLSGTMHNRDVGVFNGEGPGLRKDGSEIPTEVRGTALWDENGNYLGHICIVRDITERKNVEEKLKLLSEAVDEALDGVIITDLNGFNLYSNRAVENIYGFSSDELKGKPVSELNADPGFTGRVILQDIITKGRWAGEFMAKKKNGQEFPVWLTASIVKDDKDKPIAMVGVIKDITERKHIEEVLLEKEERYRSLFEDSPISLWEEDSSGIKKYIDALKSKGIENLRTYFDRHPKEVALCASMMKVLDVNKASINLFKAKGKSDLIDGLENIFTERSYETFKDELIAIAEGKTQFESEDIVKTLTGDKIHISMRWVLTPGNEETYSKRLVSIVDITERKRAEEEIKKYTRELEESNRMKELFADIMHHDLMNPLTTANGFIELLKENETSSRKIAYLETVERSLVKGVELIDSAMKYSNYESLKSIELEELDLKKIIEEVIRDLTPPADNAGMEIENRITLNTPVRANKIIEEVFSNIISNAIKYASSGKRIIIESENKGESLQVRVIDFGEGIKESDKTMIFERFRRGGKTGVKGSGLGLAIAGKIMELHNGRIWVEDNPEGGAVFIVEIPRNL
ncbi:MAG: PAS domain S-box protein [Candidatus Methanoperedens sp.]|nr:PAS domain S-box protein [Candidatus Methanoperedens sp.]